MFTALSITQPWAWLIVHAGNDIENRSWPTPVRGRVLIHAGRGMTRAGYAEALDFWQSLGQPDVVGADQRLTAPPMMPAFDALERGGIVGSVEIVDCVRYSHSPWFFGPFGFVLRNAKPLPFQPMRGRRGFFRVDCQ